MKNSKLRHFHKHENVHMYFTSEVLRRINHLHQNNLKTKCTNVYRYYTCNIVKNNIISIL